MTSLTRQLRFAAAHVGAQQHCSDTSNVSMLASFVRSDLQVTWPSCRRSSNNLVLGAATAGAAGAGEAAPPCLLPPTPQQQQSTFSGTARRNNITDCLAPCCVRLAAALKV